MGKKERNLTPAEQKRKADFEKICEEMYKIGYIKKDLTVGILQANIIAVIIMLPFVIADLVIYFIINQTGSTDLSFTFNEYIVFLIVFIIMVVLHEAIHGLTWGFFAKGHMNAINFGIIWKALTPYCTCAEPLTKWQYIVGGAMPTLILGFGPAIIAAALGSLWLLVLSVFMIFAGGGDFFIIVKMLLYRPQNKKVLYYDHPYECGVVAFEKL